MSFQDDNDESRDLKKPFLHTGSWYRMSSRQSSIMGSSAQFLRDGSISVVVCVLIVALGPIQFGFTCGYSSPTQAQIINELKLSIPEMVLMGVLPLGCAPSSLFQWNAMGCVDEINEVVLKYNVLLEDSIVRLNEELPDAQIVFCDLYQGVKKIITYPRFFGFEDSKNACCGLGLYGAEIGCITSDMACNVVSSNVWWDLYNPTTQVNSLLAESAWSSNYDP